MSGAENYNNTTVSLEDIVDISEEVVSRAVTAEEIQAVTTDEIKLNSEVELLPPCASYANKVRELFKLDPDIAMTWSDETKELEIKVSNPLKRLAIRRLLPEEKAIGNQKVIIKVIDAERFGGANYIPEVVAEALRGNPLFAYAHQWADPTATTNPMCWVAMDKRVVQYLDDNLNDIYGYRSILPEDLARDVLGDSTEHIFYCTVNPDKDIPEPIL